MRIAVETGRANIQFWGWNDTWGGENYGIPSGTYTPHVYVLGYVEQGPLEQVSVTLSGNPTSVSDHMYRGGGFNITVYQHRLATTTSQQKLGLGKPCRLHCDWFSHKKGSGPSFSGDPRSH